MILRKRGKYSKKGEVNNGENFWGDFIGYFLENSSGDGSRLQCELGDSESKS